MKEKKIFFFFFNQNLYIYYIFSNTKKIKIVNMKFKIYISKYVFNMFSKLVDIFRFSIFSDFQIFQYVSDFGDLKKRNLSSFSIFSEISRF